MIALHPFDVEGYEGGRRCTRREGVERCGLLEEEHADPETVETVLASLREAASGNWLSGDAGAVLEQLIRAAGLEPEDG